MATASSAEGHGLCMSTTVRHYFPSKPARQHAVCGSTRFGDEIEWRGAGEDSCTLVQAVLRSGRLVSIATQSGQDGGSRTCICRTKRCAQINTCDYTPPVGASETRWWPVAQPIVACATPRVPVPLRLEFIPVEPVHSATYVRPAARDGRCRR
jgi:hypothetical protein